MPLRLPRATVVPVVTAMHVLYAHSALVDASTFADGAVGPDDWTQTLAPKTPVLAQGSPAIDRGTPLLGDGVTGAAPDLGALEAGCDPPVYRVRPMGVDESTEQISCTGPGSSSDAGGKSGGCCGTGKGAAPTALLAVLLLAAARRRRYRRHVARNGFLPPRRQRRPSSQRRRIN